MSVARPSLNGIHCLLPLWFSCAAPDGSPGRLVPSSSCGGGVRDTSLPVVESAFARPELQTRVTEPNFGSCLTRVSDHDAHQHLEVGHPSARRRAFDPSGELVLLRSRQVVRVLDSSVVSELVALDSSWVWAHAKAADLVATHGNELLGQSLADAAPHVLQKFEEYTALAGGELGDPSRDGELALTGLRSGGGCEVFAYGIDSGRKSAAVPCPSDAVGRFVQPLYLAPTPSGASVLVAWPNLGPGSEQGLELFDANFASAPRNLGATTASFDVATDSAGVERLVSVRTSTEGRTELWQQPLAGRDGARRLLSLGRFQPAVVSCKASYSDRCVVSTGHAQDGAALADEVLLVSLASSDAAPELQRLAHHRSRPAFVSEQTESECPIAPDAVRAEASTNDDGSRLFFSSNWGDHCFGELYLVEKGDD